MNKRKEKPRITMANTIAVAGNDGKRNKVLGTNSAFLDIN
jgi:hypothetical protein